LADQGDVLRVVREHHYLRGLAQGHESFHQLDDVWVFEGLQLREVLLIQKVQFWRWHFHAST